MERQQRFAEIVDPDVTRLHQTGTDPEFRERDRRLPAGGSHIGARPEREAENHGGDGEKGKVTSDE